MRKLLSAVSTAALVICALLITGAVVRREFFPESRHTSGQELRVVGDWRALAAEGQLMGPADAPVRIVEFSDFQCPYCAVEHRNLQEVRRTFPVQVSVTYRHYPLTAVHPHAFGAATASECAGEQRMFESFHNALFSFQDSIGVVSWAWFAEHAGVPSLDAFKACIASGGAQERVKRDVAVGESLGIRGTPTVFVNGHELAGTPTTAKLKEAVATALVAME